MDSFFLFYNEEEKFHTSLVIFSIVRETHEQISSFVDHKLADWADRRMKNETHFSLVRLCKCLLLDSHCRIDSDKEEAHANFRLDHSDMKIKVFSFQRMNEGV